MDVDEPASPSSRDAASASQCVAPKDLDAGEELCLSSLALISQAVEQQMEHEESETEAKDEPDADEKDACGDEHGKDDEDDDTDKDTDVQAEADHENETLEGNSSRSLAEDPTDEETTDIKNSSPQDSSQEEEFIEVDLADIRRDVQCPICLGIIRKTRTVMECLHRFCRECIDKSIRLGNNECPVCRTHCASRRSLRDDLNFDALIAALYQDIDKYEEEEFALREENELRNKQLQESIAETFERQADAVTRRCTTAKVTAAAFVRKAQNKLRNADTHCKTRTLGDEEHSSEDGEQTVVPEPVTRERRSRRRKREPSTFQPEATDDEQAEVQATKSSRSKTGVDEVKGETSGSNAGRIEGLATWARAGSRSTARYGSNNSNRLLARATLLLDALAAASQLEKEIEFDVHFMLRPFNHDNYLEKLPSLEKPYLSCPANATVNHICEFLVGQLSIDPDEELELVLGNNEGQDFYMDNKSNQHAKPKIGHDGGESLKEPLNPEATLGEIHDLLWQYQGNLVLLYRRRF